MTIITKKLQYGFADTAGVVGQTLFKEKARFDSLQGWKYVDKLNKLKEFHFSVPNDEFHRSNTFVQREVYIPFISPFRGIIEGKASDESKITLKTKEFASHLERRVYAHQGLEKRFSYTKENWFNHQWEHRMRLKLNKKFVTEDLKDIPIPVTITNICLKNFAQADGDDILFTDKDGVTKIPHEIEKYDSATGELVAWVKVPKLSDTSDTEIYLYYDNPVATSQQDTINVWKGTNKITSGTVETTFDYAMIQHLGNDPTGGAPQYLDSTENNNDGTQTGGVTRVNGQLGQAADFDAVDDKIDCGSGTSIDDIFSGGGWIMGWIEPDSDGEVDTGAILAKDFLTHIFMFGETNGNVKIGLLKDFDGATDGEWRLTSAQIPINKKTFFAIYYNDGAITNDPVIFINNSKLTVGNGLTEFTTPAGNAVSDAGASLIIGNIPDQTRTFDGTIDEIRAMKGVIPPNIDELITTIFNITNDPNTFVTLFEHEHLSDTASNIAQDILDSANLDMPAGVTWKLDMDVPGLIPTEGLITHINFDDNVRDQVGSNNGTWTGTERYVESSLRKAGDFDGFSKVTLGDTPFDFDSDTIFNYSFIITLNGLSAAVIMLITKIDPATGIGQQLQIQTNGRPRMRFASSTDALIVEWDPTISLVDNKPHHIVLTYDGSGTSAGMKFYIDSVLQTNIVIDETVTGSTLNNNQFTIGGRDDDTFLIIGQIDNVRIYKDKILNQEDIDRLHQEGLSEISTSFDLRNHFEALQIIGEILGKDVWFDNETFKVFIGTKGKVLDEELNLVITSSPEVNTENFANIIDLVGAEDEIGKKRETTLTEETLLRFNYEKVVADDQLTSDDQLNKVGENLIDEFKKLTPLVKGEIPIHQFTRLNLQSGDRVLLIQPKKQLQGEFRIMDITADSSKAKLSLESTETGVTRIRSSSFSDVIEGILKRIRDNSL